MDIQQKEQHPLLDEERRQFILKYIYDMFSDTDLVRFRANSDYTLTISLDNKGYPQAGSAMENRRMT